jgi:hypothetical protein
MSDFAVRIEGGYAPYLRCGAVRENQKADRGPNSLWGAAGDAVLNEARAAGLVPK